MYAVERLLGSGFYVLLLVGMCAFTVHSRGRADRVRMLIIYTAFLCVAAFFYVPPETADLTRLVEIMHDLSHLNFREALLHASGRTSPVEIIYLCLIGKLGADGLLPAVTALIFCVCVFGIYDYSCENILCPVRSRLLFCFGLCQEAHLPLLYPTYDAVSRFPFLRSAPW